MPEQQQNITNIPSNRVEIIDPRTGMVSREWYRFFLNLFTLAGNGGNQTSLDDLQVGPPPSADTDSGGGGGSGTVTSVSMSVPTGLSVSGNPITSAGTLAVSYSAGYAIPTTAKQAEWDTAYADRLKWDGGATDLVAATGRTSLGSTTVGDNFFTLPNPSAITFVQINADNSITTMDAPTFRTAIGAGTGGGSVTSVGTAGTVNGLTLTGGPITTTGTITLGGTLDLSSPPTIGNTTPNTGTFTTLTATGQTSLGGDVVVTNTPLIFKNASNNEAFRINTSGSNYWQVFGATTPVLRTNGGATSAKIGMGGAFPLSFVTNSIGTEAEQLRITHTSSAVNYVQVTGGPTTRNVIASAQGSDANVGFAFQSKGTGAINLAPGSRGVNISNGGTVTAITAPVSGTSYTSIPSVAISAPTTAGGVQATGDALMFTSGAAIQSGGTGYTNGDVLTIVGGSRIGGAVGTYTVTGVSGGVITSVSRIGGSGYSVLPTNPVSTTGGTGTGATLNILWVVSGVTITNAGSGYVEQPTVTFSGGGGSGAAAFAEIGSATSLKSLNDMTVNLPSGPVLSMTDSSVASGAGAYLNLSNGSSANAIQRAAGTATNIGVFWLSKGTSGHSFGTNNSTATEQLRVTHTASAVNYVQVTGAATGSGPTISSQGSDTNAALTLQSKGSGDLRLSGGSSGWIDFRPGGVRSAQVEYVASAVNYLNLRPAVASSSPVLASTGTDTNIDLALTPKGTGKVRFGTYTADMTLIVQGYIEVKDSGGTIRKLAVIA